MLVRFGFVAMSMKVKNASPSKTMTVTSFKEIQNKTAAMRKIIRIAKQNLINTKRIIYHAIAHDIKLYRFSSRFIPLAGHELVDGRDFIRYLLDECKEIGELVRVHQMRVGFHPEHFTVLNTPKKEVLQSSIKDLIRHIKLLRAMGLNSSYKCNIHVGGTYGDKLVSYQRFIDQFERLDPRIKAYICLENDDKTFTAKETLELAQTVKVPMVLDLHHHRCNHHGETLEELWPQVIKTWNNEFFPPKIHISSPKSEADPRSHADYVNIDDLVPFLRLAKEYTNHLDVMIEAKKKDEALFRLMEQLPKVEGIERINQAAVYLS